MSRAGYSDDYEYAAVWRGQVMSSIRGKRGQAFLRELVAALDALPVKRLVKGELQKDGEVCALGSVGLRRGLAMDRIDPEDYDAVAAAFNITHQLAREIEYENDEGQPWAYRREEEPPEQRWVRVRKWVIDQIIVTPEEAGAVEIEDSSDNQLPNGSRNDQA